MFTRERVEGRRMMLAIFIVQHKQRSRSHGVCDVTGLSCFVYRRSRQLEVI